MAPTSTLSTTDALERLARYRAIGARESVDVLELGKRVLGDEGGSKVKGLGDSEWSIREQVAIAALDVGDVPYAELQLSHLSSKFRTSPRLAILKGMTHEAKGEYEAAKRVYEGLLEEDECNVSAHQRLITLALYSSSSTTTITSKPPTTQLTQPTVLTPSSSSATRTIPLLVTYLTTFQTDPSAWSLLSDLYVLLSAYNYAPNSTPFGWWFDTQKGRDGKKDGKWLGQALSALGQRMLLEPFNWMVMMRYGEIALMSGDVPLAYKTFLRAVEVATDPSNTTIKKKQVSKSQAENESGLEELLNGSDSMTRLWWWLKICPIQLLSPSYTPPQNSQTTTPSPEHVLAIDALVDEKLTELVGREEMMSRVRGLEELLR